MTKKIKGKKADLIVVDDVEAPPYETAVYPKIGTRVKYVRRKAETNEMNEIIGKPKVVIGKGVVMAIVMDASKRLMVHLIDGKDVFNTDMAAINPTPEFVERYKEVHAQIDAATDAKNAKVREMVAEGNAANDVLLDELLGPPLKIDVIPQPNKVN